MSHPSPIRSLSQRVRNDAGMLGLRLLRRTQRCLWALRSRQVPVERILMSGENGLTAAHYARVTGRLMRASTPVLRSPHTRFLQDYAREGRGILEPRRLEQTEYYRNARECIDLTGFYFDAKTPGDIRRVAERFLDRFDGATCPDAPKVEGQSARHSPVFVHPVRTSDCLQLIDGAHRVAMACARGERTIRVTVQPGAVWTPMQDLLRDVLWLKGRLELYQPVDLPEVRRWPLVRRCRDRLEKMTAFLRQSGMNPGPSLSYLDLAASYGWFVAEMASLGCQAGGVERDPVAITVGRHAYGLDAGTVRRADVAAFLATDRQTYDVTSCFSLLHHVVLGRASITPEELARGIDARTRRVFFFDTGQAHEEWFSRILSEWTPDYIESWIRSHTTFTGVHRLGPDADAVPPFEKNYGRMLFACTR